MTAPRQGATPAAGIDPAAEQLAIMSPDLKLTVAGRQITVREYAFMEGLEVAHHASGFIADMHKLSADGVLRYDRIRRLIGLHRDVTVKIAAQSAGVEPAWVNALGRDDAETFFSAWFGVNAGFFVHEVVMEMREERLRAALAMAAETASTGSEPSAAWLPPESETTSSSSAAQNAS